MLQAGLAFLGGCAAYGQCGDLPCHARLSTSGQTFKLGVFVHGTSLYAVDGPGIIENQRPRVVLAVGGKSKETELGDWSKEMGRWRFQEVITVVVTVDDEIRVSVMSSTHYNLVLASLLLTSRSVGQVCFPVAQILPLLHSEDRDADGLVFVTEEMPLDIYQDGRVTGKIYVSFETKTQFAVQKLVEAHRVCCAAWPGGGLEFEDLDGDENHGVGHRPRSKCSPRLGVAVGSPQRSGRGVQDVC